MTNIYLKYPEITKLKANIISRRYQQGHTQVILDRTIFMPRSAYLLNDLGTISDLDVISVDEKRNNIIHLLNGKPNKSKVDLIINDDIRMRNLYYNTSFVLFKIFFNTFYTTGNLTLQLGVDEAKIILDRFYDIFDPTILEEQINFAISKSLKIKNEQGITGIKSIGEIVNNEICFDNTSKVLGFKVLSSNKIDQKYMINFICGTDLTR